MLFRIKKYKSFIAAIKKLDANPNKWKILGSGTYGCAYDMGDGRVCKITTSKRETEVARKLKRNKKNYTYLYKILEVFTIKKQEKFKYGLIITPKYKKLTDNQKAELYELFCFLNLTPRFKLRSIEQIKRKIKKAVKDYYCARQTKNIVETVISRRIKTFKKFDVLYMLRNLKSARLGPEDIHYENILKDKDNFILIDIGC